MAWSTPLTAVANAALTSSQWNLSVRDNLLETPAAKATTTGSHFATSATNTVVERIPTEAIVATSEATASTTYVDLATVGPTLATVACGTRALIAVTASVLCDTQTQSGRMSVDLSRATVSAATDDRALRVANHATATAGTSRASFVTVLTGLTAGNITFTAKYRTSGTSNSTFSERRLAVIPF